MEAEPEAVDNVQQLRASPPQNLRTFVREENAKLLDHMRNMEKRLEARVAALEKLIG